MEGDRLYVNATFYTMDAASPVGEALLTRGDRIVSVGPLRQVESASGAGTRRIDLDGAAVVPGFNDSHAHVLWYGMALDQLDVSVQAVRTVEDIKRAVDTRARETEPGRWVVGRGYDQNMLEEGRHPTRADIDAVSHDHPVMLQHTSGHVLTCNSAALRAAGVTRATEVPPGGVIDRDAHGEPTGVMKESAMDLVRAAIPPPSVDEGERAIRRAMESMAGYGITSASDAATGTGPTIDSTIRMYERAASTDDLAGRIQLMPQIHYVAPPGDETVISPDAFTIHADPLWLSVGPTKIFSDGALSTRTAALREPYADDENNRGIVLWPIETLESMISRAHAAGWQIATHALGDRAVQVVTSAYKKALEDNPRSDHRHRIEHCMLLDEPLAREIQRLGIVPSLQPDIFRLGDGYVAGLGYDRACTSIPIGTFRRLGVRVALSSDTPVIPCNPLPIIRSAVERRTPAGVQLGISEASTVEEAIRGYTTGGAYATHTDHMKGALRPGLLADFAVLSHDPMTVPIEDFHTVTVVMTVVGGRQTFAA